MSAPNRSAAADSENNRPSAEDEARERQRRGSQPANRRLKNLQRFDYWNIPAINPFAEDRHRFGIPSDDLELDRAVHAELERIRGDVHRAGDHEAIFQYAQEDAWCFRSAWFVEQVEAWRDDGEDAQLLKLMRVFARNRSKVNDIDLRAIVQRDQRIFERVTERPNGQSLNRCFGDLANEFNVSEDTIRDVYEHYQPYFGREAANGVDPMMFFSRLADMLKRFP